MTRGVRQRGSRLRVRAVVVMLGLVGAWWDAECPQVAAEPLDVGDQKQLFIDHKFIDAKQNIRLAVNPPEKLAEPILKSDKPWEAYVLAYWSVVEEDGLFRMWYQPWEKPIWNGTDTSKVCYAESTDGRSWVKPNQGLLEFNGSTDNNILIDGGQDCRLAYVFKDTNPNCPPAERYKMLYGYGVTRMRTSADGLHWTDPGPVVWWLWYDTQKQAWWDEPLNKYVVHVRAYSTQDTNSPSDLEFPFVSPIPSDPPVVAPKTCRAGRALARVEVDDIMRPWPVENCRTILCGDELDPPETDIYHPGGVYKYPYAADAYFMFPWIYEHWPKSPVSNDGVINAQFAASRDGWHWMRYDRKVYIPRGKEGELDYGCAQPLGPFFRDGDHLYQFYSGWPWTHGGWRAMSPEEQAKPAHWGRKVYRLNKYRLDGFVSADAPPEGGWFVTPPIVFSGGHLELNIAVDAKGSTRAELQDEQGRPIPAFSLEECDPILCDDVRYTVRWKGKSDLSALTGRPVRLKLSMRSAKLYAYQFRGGN